MKKEQNNSLNQFTLESFYDQVKRCLEAYYGKEKLDHVISPKALSDDKNITDKTKLV